MEQVRSAPHLTLLSNFQPMSKLPFNYRKFYEKQTNKKIPKDFDIHHIDLNRENNDIINLVAIPKCLHRKYHTLLGKMMHFDNFILSKNDFTPWIVNDSYYFADLSMTKFEIENISNNINDMQLLLFEIMQWCNYKNLLLNILPDWKVEESQRFFTNIKY